MGKGNMIVAYLVMDMIQIKGANVNITNGHLTANRAIAKNIEAFKATVLVLCSSHNRNIFKQMTYKHH